MRADPNRYRIVPFGFAMSVARSSTDHDVGDAADLISTL
jgi:hypothetical protein